MIKIFFGSKNNKINLIMFIIFIIAVAIFVTIVSRLQYMVNKQDNQIRLDQLVNVKDNSEFKYKILNKNDENTVLFEQKITKQEFDKIDNQNQPYKIIMYKIAGNWFKVYFNDTLIGTKGNTTKDNSIIWNVLSYFDIDKNLVQENNSIKIEIFGQYEIGNLSFLPIITNLDTGTHLIGWLQFLTNIYSAAIGILIMCFLLLIMLSTLIEQKNLSYIGYALATLLSAIFILDSTTITNPIFSLLVFKKIIYFSVYGSIATFSLAIHFYFKRKSPLIFGCFLYGFTVLLLILSTDTIILKNMSIITNIVTLMTICDWLFITVTEKNKRNDAKILFYASLFLLFTSVYEVAYMIFNIKNVYNYFTETVFGALFFCLAMVIMIISDYIDLNIKMNMEKEKGIKFYNKSITDEMTKVYNKAFLTSLLSKITGMYTIIMIDADKFKSINDNYGHESGDEVIKYIARSCSENVRENDYVCRQGGDEFIVVLPFCNEKRGYNVATDILDAFRKTFTLSNGTVLNLTLSMGVYCNLGNISYTEALNKADQAQYVAKKNGRNQVVAFTEAEEKNLIVEKDKQEILPR